MAGLAARTQRLLVYVILTVALTTLGTRILENSREMALLAGRHRMHSNQRESRHIMLKSYFLCPTLLIMASCAFFTLLPVVHIIIFVAVHALATERLIIQLAPVTGAAQQIGMLPSQRKIRFVIMVKLDLFPSVRPMAGVALLSVLPSVLVIITMT